LKELEVFIAPGKNTSFYPLLLLLSPSYIRGVKDVFEMDAGTEV